MKIIETKNIIIDSNDITNILILEDEDNISMKYKINRITHRIQKEICFKTIDMLNDESLLNDYMKSKSIKQKTSEVMDMLKELNIADDKRNTIVTGLFKLGLISPGLKGSIRGNRFNEIVKNYILSLNIDLDVYDIKFETHLPLDTYSEKPDWFIINKNTSRILIGMNQVDLWNGGAQSNRANKYIIQNIYNTRNSKLLCVICNETTFTTLRKTKKYNIFNIGFQNDTLCYIKKLKEHIYNWFGL